MPVDQSWERGLNEHTNGFVRQCFREGPELAGDRSGEGQEGGGVAERATAQGAGVPDTL